MKAKKAFIKRLMFAIFIAFAAALLASPKEIRVTSPAFQPGADIPLQFTCEGSDASPPLQIDRVPPEAKSLVLIVDDPDAPSGLFTHWVLWNVDPKAKEISGNNIPSNAVSGKNDFGKVGYRGPCPPSGTHRYFFRIFALDRSLDLAPGSGRAQLEAQTQGHIIAQGELVGRYRRKR